jgi:3-hydroxyisobutyrate dehydrogenase
LIIMADGKKERVGIVGAGRMGLAMLKHFINKGYAVTVCDISDKQRDAARALGAAVVTTPAEVGKASDIVILGVGYDDEVNDVVFGTNGLSETMARGSIIAVSSTAKPDNMKNLASRVAANGIEVIDAPICRGRFAADNGTLLALVGGKTDIVERARPV